MVPVTSATSSVWSTFFNLVRHVKDRLINNESTVVSSTKRVSSHTATLLLLPDDVLRLLNEYTDIADGACSLTCRRMYQFRKSCICMKLSVSSSLRYYNDAVFCDRVHSSVDNVGKQLSLCLKVRSEIIDVSMFGTLHALDLSGCINISDFSMLRTVHTLNLSGCYMIVDVSMLRKVHTLNLSDCKDIVDVSMFHTVHT